MLEHVSRQFAERYLEHLRGMGVADADIQRLTAINDRRGAPIMLDFAPKGGRALRASGSSLRYLYHALLIFNHAPDIENVVEVGGGYGGLALMLDAVFAWKGRQLRSYRIYDIGGPRLLQMAYLEEVDAGRGVFCWGDSSTSGEDLTAECPLSLLTSTYAISEFPDRVADMYLIALAHRADHLFFAWNNARKSVFMPEGVQEWDEDPQTGSVNRLILYR
jgi:hypothetical protein